MVSVFSGCTKKEDIDWSKIDLSNIENLYAQPLQVIQKAVQGKWKLLSYYGSHHEVPPFIDDPHGTYMHINGNHFILGDKTHGIILESQIIWEKLEKFMGEEDAYTFIFNPEYILTPSNLNFHYRFLTLGIKNDTLSVWNCMWSLVGPDIFDFVKLD